MDKHYGELDTDITYTITYTNSGENPIVESYFYDVLPYSGGPRGSRYEGDRDLTDISFAVKKLYTGEVIPDSGASVTIYGSAMDSPSLQELLFQFNNLENTSERNEKIVEILARPDFVELGTTEDQKGVNGIVVKVEKLAGHQDMEVTLTMKTKGNKAGDTYLNAAWHWDSGSGALPLQSNIVQTRVISRTISGLVWYDENRNSTRENREPRIPGVTVSLFRKDETGSYIPCTQGVTSKGIATGGGSYTKNGTVITGADGSYYFGELLEGDYVAAFSGAPLADYLKQTSYQRSGVSQASNSDGVQTLPGVTLKDASGTDITANYAYFIQYTPQTPGMPLHSLQEIAAGQVTLNNGVEAHLHMDLGLINGGPELPLAGGSGTIVLTISGLLLTAAAGAVLFRRRRREWK